MKARDWRRLRSEAFLRGWQAGSGHVPPPEAIDLDTPPPKPRRRRLAPMTGAERAGLAKQESDARALAVRVRAHARARG